ncbi:MAG TPA: diguanylate cyclase [Polyangia bacterium]|nr:diguanylate cyclase [Polyangia bacterium]
MSTRWERALYRLRRTLAASVGLLIALGLAGLDARGFFGDLRASFASGSADLWHVAALGALCALLVSKLAARLRAPPPALQPTLADTLRELELGLTLLVATFAALEMTGGAHSPLYPLLYLLSAYLVAFHRPAASLPLCAVAAGLEVLTNPERDLAAVHVVLLCVFALTNLVFLHAEIWRSRREARARVEREISAMRDEARDFRLISSALGAESRTRTRAEEEAKLAQGAVETIHQSLFYTLELLKKSLDLHTCVLLWLDNAGERLKIKELITDSDLVVERDVPADAGALGAIVKDRLLVSLRQPVRGQLPYYRGPEDIGAFVGVPVEEEGHLRGVLAADRRSSRPFDDRDEALLQGAARQILRAIQSERVFAAVERSKYEKERFYRASEMLNQALTLEQVFDVTVRAAREIVDFDFAAIALRAKDTRKHTICRVEGDGKRELEGLSFSDNAGLAAMVVKNKHYLPVSGERAQGDEAPVFTKRVKALRGYASLLVLPLVCADEAIGSFTLAARRRGVFGKDKRDMLGVIANQVGISIENAKMYRLMEEMATTDGLTGLYNHRTFQERIAMMLDRSERLDKKCSLILCDIDHFKSINDTYGHPVGDVVLRRVAQLLASSVRKIDLVARYGGEEFALVLEETYARGARELAERVRLEVAKQQFTSDQGGFQITLSLGIASYPDDGRDKQILIEKADQALYTAKRSGRNRSVHHADLAAGRCKPALLSAS